MTFTRHKTTPSSSHREYRRRWRGSHVRLQLRLFTVSDVEYLTVAPCGYPLQLCRLSGRVLTLTTFRLTRHQDTAHEATHGFTVR